MTMRPRRWRIVDQAPLRSPSKAGGQYRLQFRFRETFANLLEWCPVSHTGARGGSNGTLYAYLNADEDGLEQVRAWLRAMERLVACRDLLAVSFALDYDREDGSPDQPQTSIAALRREAKPYDRAPSTACHGAAARIADTMLEALSAVTAYEAADMVVAMPPSEPDRPYDLPRILAAHVADRTGREDGTAFVITTRERPQLKNLGLAAKLDALDGTIAVEASAVKDRTVLLVDDLYQSGVSMNFVAMKLQQAGARAILGLAAEKTCRNDDNRPRP